MTSKGSFGRGCNLKKQNIQQSSIMFSPSARTSYSFPFLQIHDTNIMGNYGCNSFINLFFDQTYIELFEKDCFYALDGLFDVYHQKIYKYKLCPNSEEIRKYFFEKIENGYCITCHWDEFYVSESHNFKLNHTDKECLIY